jgi:anti-sigma B factor antagonist
MTVPPFRATIADLGRGLCLVSVSGELDLYVGPDLRAALSSAGGPDVRTLVIDLSGVSFMDSTICGILVGEAKRRRSVNGELVLVANGPRTRGVLELTGVDHVVRTFPTLHDVLQMFLLEPAV